MSLVLFSEIPKHHWRSKLLFAIIAFLKSWIFSIIKKTMSVLRQNYWTYATDIFDKSVWLVTIVGIRYNEKKKLSFNDYNDFRLMK